MIATKSSEFKKKYKEAKKKPRTPLSFGELLVRSDGKRDVNATKIANNFQEYLKKHYILLASMHTELPMLEFSANIISRMKSDKDALEHVKRLKPVYQSKHRRIKQLMSNYNVELNKQSIEDLKNLLLQQCEKKSYKYYCIKTDFDTMLDLINKSDIAIQFLLQFMEQIINTQEYDSTTKKALENISKYTPQLYERLKNANKMKETTKLKEMHILKHMLEKAHIN